ncbi:hypothetical protein SRRS_44890 [Sporomusa rhizae]|uniref:hypothetical protein n=1 Tax=Sporomusa rhizae TaxID=357999 RepID=UPI00352A54CB
MPHIKSVRIVNVHFNNATQFYDDFKLEPAGKNTTYDLENGGGKSLLLLLILQTILPKAYLRKEKPVSLLFHGGKDRTSHVAVEWILEAGSGYKYLLTGFCARKRRGSSGEPSAATDASGDEENLQAADIEHLNWCVFYNDNKITSIKSVPFVTGETGRKAYAGFEDIRKYVQQLRQKGLPAEVFDKIEHYQRYISAHSLITSEWNIIRGINSGETNIESYFRQNATSRKLIENQFVKIVEDMEALNKGDKHNDESRLLADTLIEIRSRLNEYLKLKGHMAEYEKIKEYYTEFSRKNDDLLQAFQEYETYKAQAAAIRNLIGNELSLLEQQGAAALNSRNYNTTSSNEGKSLKKLLEAGWVTHEKGGLLTVSRELQTDWKHLSGRQAELEKHLNHLLTLEGYGEYRTDKEKFKECDKRLQLMAVDSGGLQAEYQAAGGRLRFLTNRQLAGCESLLSNSRAAKDELTEERKKKQQALIETAQQEAVIKTAINGLVKSEKSLAEKHRELSDFFLDRGETEAILFAKQFLQQIATELDAYLQENTEVSDKIKLSDTKLWNLELEIVKTTSEIQKWVETKQQYDNRLKAYQDQLTGLEQQAAKFGKGTRLEYHQSLELLLDQERLNKLEKEIEAGRIRQKQQLSEARGYYVPNEEILVLAAKLDDKCEFVQAGIDWIAKANPEEKALILRMMPYLPFAVIVDRQSFEKLKTGRLKPDFVSDYPVPVVNIETVRRIETNEQDNVFYICSFADMVLDGNRYEQYAESIETALKNSDSEISAIKTRIVELSAVLEKVNGFYAQYPAEQMEAAEKNSQTLAKQITALNKRLQDINAENSKIVQEKNSLQDREEQLVKLTTECREKQDKLLAAIQTESELTEMREQLTAKRRELEAVSKNAAIISAAINALDKQYDLLEEQIKHVSIELHELKKDHFQLASFAELETDLLFTQVRAEYTALHEAVSGRKTEESDLRSRINDYRERLEVLSVRIKRDYGGDLAALEKSEESGVRISIPSQSMIEQTKQSMTENAARLKTVDKELQVISLKIENADGRLKEILKDFPETAERDLPMYDSEIRYKQEIETVELLIESYEQAICKANEELEAIKEKTGRLHNQMESYNDFIEREQVANAGMIALEIKEFRLFEKEYYKLKDVIQRQYDKWDNRIKTISGETAEFIIREPLDELEKISRPSTTRQCLDKQQAFAEYIMSLEEQMQKISSDIVQLESYQQDFTRRCVQRAELVLGHLRKLESFSRIEVYGRRTNMIELKLQEFEEKEKYLRMKSHIEGIVREIGEEANIDRKRITDKLSIKELLAQIVDLEKAAVRLYKIESIPENSRFYRWENAIGSEGQNNSLYFIFAVCLLSFIRMLSITTSTVRTKKVIIADNPFGATSAVYLWDPMFQIMKQNDVQLIAPGHRIPREITSRFGVSYLLNQDILEDGRMRVVVKDVRVEEDEDVLRYIEPEQLSFF